MAKYYQDFVGLNTFVYDMVGWDVENQVAALASQVGRETKVFRDDGLKGNLEVFQNHFMYDFSIGPAAPSFMPAGFGQSTKNFQFPFNLPTTASFFPALMLRRNGPYGYPMWKQT